MYLTLGNAPSRTWGPSVRCATLARERHSRSWIWELIQAPPVVPAGRSDPSRSGCLATADRNVGPSSPIRHPHVRHPGRSTAALEIDPGPSARTVRRTPSIARRIRRLQYFLRWLPRAASRGLAAPAQPIRILPVRCLGWCADSTGEIPDSRPPPPRRKASGNARGGDARERGACFPSPHQRRDMGRGGRRAASPAHPPAASPDFPCASGRRAPILLRPWMRPHPILPRPLISPACSLPPASPDAAPRAASRGLAAPAQPIRIIPARGRA